MVSIELDSRTRRTWNLLISFIKESLFLNAGYLISVDAVNSLMGFLFWWVSARVYSPQDIGFASAIISAVSLITMLSSLGTGSGMIRYLPEKLNSYQMINSIFLFNVGCSFIV
jgi:O-antigen/teichoic acid export membrane protein